MTTTDATRHAIGRYEVLRQIGRGSQGSVHLARDPMLDRYVAVKVLDGADPELNLKDADGTPLEARIASKLKHPNIVPIYDAGETAGYPYLVFEYVEGTPLAARLAKDGALSLEDAVPVIAAVLEGMSAAHAADVLHLDLNPRNVLVDGDGVPRIMDFGLAQYVNFTPQDDEMVSGTLCYMSPEHMLGRPIGPWTDVFALGCTFFELVSGRRAFAGLSVEEVQLQIIGVQIDFSALAALPHGKAFVQFLRGALERDAAGRYADAGAMREAFGVFLRETGLTAAAAADTSHSTIEFLMRRMQRRKDFPTVSQTLSDINRLTGDDSAACADQLSNVILRDFALTSKLLRLVNSAFYGTRSAEITSVSQAVVFLGLEQVRMTANSLMFFGHLKGDAAALKDSLTRSFLAGLIARHLARQMKLPQAEEAFIAGLCQNLGENLAIYYFTEEYDDIEALRAEKDLDKAAASRGILGVSYAELGAAVARSWNLPDAIVAAVRGLPPGPVQVPADNEEQLRDIAVLANELADLFQSRDRDEMQSELHWLLLAFKRSIALEREYCVKLIAAGFRKLEEFAPVFEIQVANSRYCRAVREWLAVQTEDIYEVPDEAAGRRAAALAGRQANGAPTRVRAP